MKTKPATMAAINRQLAEIGNAIAQQYATGACRKYQAPGFVYGVDKKGTRCEIWDDHTDFVEFNINGHKARCLDTPEAVAAIVRKYHKGADTRLKRAYHPTLPAPDRAGYGVDYGAQAVVEHETLPA